MGGRETQRAVAKPEASSPGTRRAMQSNRRTDTKLELAVRRELHHRGLRFRKDLAIHLLGLRVRPDVVFTKARVAVMIDGCWWHGCSEHHTYPKRNAAFWRHKIETTIERDRRVTASLAEAGWTVIRVWEHEPVSEAAERIELAVRTAYGASLVVVRGSSNE
jgi:DNA mismatch endonuclease (patch repair protein)